MTVEPTAGWTGQQPSSIATVGAAVSLTAVPPVLTSSKSATTCLPNGTRPRSIVGAEAARPPGAPGSTSTGAATGAGVAPGRASRPSSPTATATTATSPIAHRREKPPDGVAARVARLFATGCFSTGAHGRAAPEGNRGGATAPAPRGKPGSGPAGRLLGKRSGSPQASLRLRPDHRCRAADVCGAAGGRDEQATGAARGVPTS